MSMIADPTSKKAHLWDRQAEDHYVEPRSCSDRLFQALPLDRGSVVLDPACGFGRIPRAAALAGHIALGSDIVPRWRLIPAGDDTAADLGVAFLQANWFSREWPPCADRNWSRPDAIVSNPPFSLAQEFADLALARTGLIVALLLPTKWLNGAERSAWRATTPLQMVMPINPRPSMPPGHVLLDGKKPGGGTVDFSWFVWCCGHRGPAMIVDLPPASKVAA